jgi:DNA polymerase-3 subunit delta
MIKKYFDLKKINLSNFNLFLFYGKNDGLQNEVINDTFTSNFKGSVNKYDETEFINNYETLASELLTSSLFEKEKIIIISRTSDKILKFVDEILDKGIKEIKIIFKSSELEKRSKIRIFFEKRKDLIIVPFYEDNSSTLSSIVIKFLNENNINMSRESINLLVDRANGNRKILKTELDKILNYSFTKKKIDLRAVQKLTNLNENYGVNELADNYLEKNKKNIAKILNENIYSDEDCILILRTVLSKSKRLINIIKKYNETKNLDEVIANNKPPIFWKDKDSVKRQANSWKIKDLKEKIYQINEVETLIKNNSKNSLNLVSDFIVNI